MKLIEYTDPDGTKHLSWLRDADLDDAPQEGIPHDPPDLSGLGLPERTQRKLNNILVGQRLIVWRHHDLLIGGLRDALKQIRRLDLLEQLAALYEDRQTMPGYRADFDLNYALGGGDLTPTQKACIKQMFRQANITSLELVENAPAIFRGHICGIDIYQLVAHILNRFRTA